MPLILCVETSSVLCSVSLFEGENLLASKEEGESYRHSELLHLFIKEVLDRGNKKPIDLDAVAVGSGPGSFTGLRIGYAAAKGLCYALKIPLISVSTLELMTRAALQLPVSHQKSLCPMIDARRMEVYSCIFNTELKITRPLQAVIVEEDSYKEDLETGPLLFFGDGMPKIKKLFQTHPNAYFLEHIMPSSLFMAPVAVQKFESKDFEDTAYAEPLYYKDFQPTTPKKKL
ncbi:MAG: tRNA (adenosine(37)-N6)-threonylcarbamoyltransferase complex dimerization subunit type 1 TsaB [Vicingaceae bacterium]